MKDFGTAAVLLLICLIYSTITAIKKPLPSEVEEADVVQN